MSDSPPEEAGKKSAVSKKPAAKKAAKNVVTKQVIEDAGEKEREDAFNEEFSWRGEPLEPFSLSRLGLFNQQRTAVGAPSFSAVIEADGNDAFMPDAFRILWICSHSPEVFRSLRSEPEKMQDAIDEWVDANVTKKELDAAMYLGIRIYNSAYHNDAESIGSGEPGGASGN